MQRSKFLTSLNIKTWPCWKRTPPLIGSLCLWKNGRRKRIFASHLIPWRTKIHVSLIVKFPLFDGCFPTPRSFRTSLSPAELTRCTTERSQNLAQSTDFYGSLWGNHWQGFENPLFRRFSPFLRREWGGGVVQTMFSRRISFQLDEACHVWWELLQS